MVTAYNLTAQRPREWRRRVSMPARVQHGGQWAGSQILNLSSRGMLIHYARPLSIGTRIEVRQGAHAVTAMVVWQRGGRAGLHCSSGIGIVDWLECAAKNAPVDAPTGDPQPVERRRSARPPDRARETGRKIEFVVIAGGVVAGALSLAAGAAATLAVPLHEVALALSR